MKILSRKSAIEFITNDPFYPTIAIGETPRDSVLNLASIAKNCLVLRFDDIPEPREGYQTITEDHVDLAIQFAKDKDDLIVACHMGISRSSALAYVIACSKNKNYKECLNILNPNQHRPNPLVVKTGSKFLEDESIWRTYCRWMRKYTTWFILKDNGFPEPDIYEGEEGIHYYWDKDEYHLELDILDKVPAEFFYRNRETKEYWGEDWVVGEIIPEKVSLIKEWLK